MKRKPGTGSVYWLRGTWWLRLSAKGGGKCSPIEIPGFGQHEEEAANLAADLHLANISGVGKTCAQWFDEYFDSRAAKFSTTEDSRSRIKKWVNPCIGHLEPRHVAAEHVRSIVRRLDAAVEAEELSWKTALNVWGDVTGAFDEMVNSKTEELAILRGRTNPAKDVRGPDRGVERTKPFLRPREVSALLSCPAIPLSSRVVYAVAIYTAMRQGELRALLPSDVMLEDMQIRVMKQARKVGKVKERTKTGRGRHITIEPNLAPLLRWLVDHPMGRDGYLLRLPPAEDCADLLRRDLKTAGCDREELYADDAQREQIKFHSLRNTCGVHMAVRGDAPFSVQHRLGHTNAAMTEHYIAEARMAGGTSFGNPLAALDTFWTQDTENVTKRRKFKAQIATPTGIEEIGAVSQTSIIAADKVARLVHQDTERDAMSVSSDQASWLGLE